MVKRYQRHTQKPYIKEGQSIQWPKDTKGIIRSCKSKEDCQYNGQKTSKAYPEAYIKEGQSIQWSKEKRTKGQTMNDLQNTRQNTKDQATRAPTRVGWTS